MQGVVVVGDTCASEQGRATIIGGDKRYPVCGSVDGFYLALRVTDNLQSDEGVR